VNFKYIAYNEQRILTEGVIEGATERLAEAALAESGYRVVSLKAARQGFSLQEALPSLFKVKPQHLIAFSRQLATLLGAGITMVTALELIREQMPNRAFKDAISRIIDELHGGKSLGQALANQPRVFSRMYSRMAEVGERTGSLEKVLNQLADYMEKQSALSRKVVNALIYPVAILCLAVVVVAILITVVLPPIINLYATMKVELPFTTRILTTGASFLIAYKLQIGLAAGAVIVFAVWYLRTSQGRMRLQLLLPKVPLLGPVMLQREMAHLCRTMSMLVQAGLPMPDAMELLAQTTGNEVVRRALDNVRAELIQGHGLAKPMAANKLFPRMMVQMVTVGEQTGTLESNLQALGDSYEADVDTKLSRLVSLIEPAITILVAFVIGFLAVSVVTPLYSILGSMK